MTNIFYQSVLLEAVMHYTLCTVKVYIYIYIYSYWVKSTLSHGLYVLVSEENAQWPVAAAAVLVYMGFVLFCFCVVNWYLKNKKKKKPQLLFTDWKITAFYTTEILSQDFPQQALGSSYCSDVDGESSVVSPHNGRVCTNLGVLPSILYIFIILIVQNCIIFCNHHIQSVFVFHFNFFNIKRGSMYLQACWNSSYFLMWFIGMGNPLLRIKWKAANWL